MSTVIHELAVVIAEQRARIGEQAQEIEQLRQQLAEKEAGNGKPRTAKAKQA